MKKKEYNVLSPDGFAIHHENTYTSKKKAEEAFKKWRDAYKAQGYYSWRGERIPLNELHQYCQLVEL